MGVYASAEYLATHARPAEPAELAATREQHALVVCGSDGWAKPWLFNGARGRPFGLEVTPRFTANSLEVLAQAASGTLAQVFDEAEPFGYPLHALWPQSRSMPTRQRIVIDALARQLPPLMDANAGRGALHGNSNNEAAA